MIQLIDIAKGIAIILVVYGHVIEHSMAPWQEDFFQNPVFKIIYTFHMPLFVFISGYLMAFSLNKHSVGDVFQSRCKSLLVPFVSLGILGMFMAYVLDVIFGYNTGEINMAGDLANQLLLKPTVWFLFTLFAMSFLLLYSVRLEKRLGLAIFAGIYFIIMAIPYNNYCALYYIKWFYLFYLAGYFVNQCKMKTFKTSLNTIVFVFSLILFSCFLIFWKTSDYIYINKMNFMSNHYGGEILRIIYRYIMGFLGIVITLYIAGYFSKIKKFYFLEIVGRYSLDIYIIQMFLLEGIYPRMIHKMNIHLDFNSPWVLYMAAPLITVFFTGICILISKLLIRKNNLLDKLLLGGRNSITHIRP